MWHRDMKMNTAVPQAQTYGKLPQAALWTGHWPTEQDRDLSKQLCRQWMSAVITIAATLVQNNFFKLMFIYLYCVLGTVLDNYFIVPSK